MRSHSKAHWASEKGLLSDVLPYKVPGRCACLAVDITWYCQLKKYREKLQTVSRGILAGNKIFLSNLFKSFLCCLQVWLTQWSKIMESDHPPLNKWASWRQHSSNPTEQSQPPILPFWWVSSSYSQYVNYMKHCTDQGAMEVHLALLSWIMDTSSCRIFFNICIYVIECYTDTCIQCTYTL